MNHFPYFWLSSQFSFIIQPWIKICGKNFPCCYSLTVCSAYFEFNYIIAWWIKLKTYFLPCFWIVCVSSHIDIFPWATDSVSTTKIPFIFSLFAPPPPPQKKKNPLFMTLNYLEPHLFYPECSLPTSNDTTPGIWGSNNYRSEPFKAANVGFCSPTEIAV